MRYFYDIGANVGQTFDWFLLKDARWRDYHVVCFEPSPRHLTALAAKCRDMTRAGAFAGVTLVPAAVESTAGLGVFHEKVSPLADSLVSDLRENRGGLDIEVPLIGLSQYLCSHTVSEDRVTIKIDAEGSEYSMLWSLIHDIRRIEKLMVEWHGGEAYIAQRLELEGQFAKRGLTIEEWPF